MTEQDKKEYLIERQKKTTPPMKTWAPTLTPEQEAERERYIRDNNLPF